MKQVTFAVGLLALGLALGLVLPQVFAQSPQAERARERAGVGAPGVQQWEQFCEWPSAGGTEKKASKAANASLASHGKEGYQLVSAFGPRYQPILCYRRPAR